MTVELMDQSLAAKVRGGIPDSAPEGMWADVLGEVDADGNRIWEWAAAEHLDVENTSSPSTTGGTSGATAILWRPSGTTGYCSAPQFSTVGIIDKASGDIIWELGYETWRSSTTPICCPTATS